MRNPLFLQLYSSAFYRFYEGSHYLCVRVCIFRPRKIVNKRAIGNNIGKRSALRCALVLALLLICGNAVAQFTIPTQERKLEKVPGLGDSVRTVVLQPEEYYSEAREKAERRARRKERNYVQFDVRFDMSQTQFDNWVAGSDNTFMGKITLDFQHKYTREKLSIESKVNARYGMNYIERRMFKNEDYFRINHTVAWKLSKYWSYSATSELTSQFTIGRVSRTDKTKRSNFMAPGYWKPAIGLTYGRAPWTIDIAPIGGSATFMLDKGLSRKGGFGVAAGKKSQWQVGSSLRVEYKRNFLKNVIEFKSEVYAFTNYTKPPIGRWETTCKIRAAKFITTTIYTKLLYDRTAHVPHPKRIQCNYSLGVGLSYTFKNK